MRTGTNVIIIHNYSSIKAELLHSALVRRLSVLSPCPAKRLNLGSQTQCCHFVVGHLMLGCIMRLILVEKPTPRNRKAGELCSPVAAIYRQHVIPKIKIRCFFCGICWFFGCRSSRKNPREAVDDTFRTCSCHHFATLGRFFSRAWLRLSKRTLTGCLECRGFVGLGCSGLRFWGWI